MSLAPFVLGGPPGARIPFCRVPDVKGVAQRSAFTLYIRGLNGRLCA